MKKARLLIFVITCTLLIGPSVHAQDADETARIDESTDNDEDSGIEDSGIEDSGIEDSGIEDSGIEEEDAQVVEIVFDDEDIIYARYTCDATGCAQACGSNSCVNWRPNGAYGCTFFCVLSNVRDERSVFE
ncbi:MAG: hypothetical protein AAFV53_26015 [Myxococcota bacterium]